MSGWFIYVGAIFVASLVLGWHLGRFRDACSEMTGMMAGMTIGMLGGFALGYGMAAATGRDLFVGNLAGVLLGALLGVWFGQAGGLMGMMDGGMGGVMGGSMGAMIAAMLYFNSALVWTGVLFAVVFVVGALALVVLIESRTPDYTEFHVLFPLVSRFFEVDSGEDIPEAPVRRGAAALAASASRSNTSPTVTTRVEETTKTAVARPLVNYYVLLKVSNDADVERIEEAYLDLLATGDAATQEKAERGLAILTDPEKRARYDTALANSLKRQPIPADTGRGDCCPPKKKKTVETAPSKVAPVAAAAPAPAPAPAVSAVATHTPAQVKAATPTPGAGNGKKGKQNKQYGGQTAQARPQAQGKSQGQGARNHSGSRGSARRYAESGLSAGRLARGIALGAGVSLVVLVVFWVVLSAASGASASSGSGAGNGYNYPRGAVYHAPGPAPDQAALEKDAVAATLGSDGVQTADLVLDPSNSTYNPSAIKVKAGVPVRLNVTQAGGGGRDCRSVVTIPALNAQAVAIPGQTDTMSFTPRNAGVYEFNCPMRMMNPSYLVVTN